MLLKMEKSVHLSYSPKGFESIEQQKEQEENILEIS